MVKAIKRLCVCRSTQCPNFLCACPESEDEMDEDELCQCVTCECESCIQCKVMNLSYSHLEMKKQQNIPIQYNQTFSQLTSVIEVNK